MKKIMYVGAGLVVVGVLGLGMLASAQQMPGMPGDNASGTGMGGGVGVPTIMSIHRMAPPIIISVDANGHATVRGTLLSVSGATLTIQSWGMQFTVDTSNAQIVGSVMSVVNFAVGDVIGVQGMLNASSSGVIAATVVRDWGSSADMGTVQGLGGNGSSMWGMHGGMGMPMMPVGQMSSGTPSGTPTIPLSVPAILNGLLKGNGSGTFGMPPGMNVSGTPGMMDGQGMGGQQGGQGQSMPSQQGGGQDNQALQQKLQMLLQELNQLQGGRG